MEILGYEIKENNILVIGDIMLDCYYKGSVNRISPEAPVPVFSEKKKEMVPGGAANVAINIMATGQRVTLVSIMGEDNEGKKLREILEMKGIDCSKIIIDPQRPTTTKNRFLGENNQQLLRHDREIKNDINEEMQIELLAQIEASIEEYSLIVVSDYGKGVCTETVLQGLVRICNCHDKKIITDVKGKNAYKYKGFFLIKPNRHELEELMGKQITTRCEVIDAAKELCNQCQARYIVTTCGQEGMITVDENGNIIEFKSNSKNVYDVTGAGDTVIAFLALGIANGMRLKDILYVANFAAGIQVSKVGRSVVSIHEVKACMNQKKKIVSVDELICLLKERGTKKIVFTNGCFDIIHAGHIRILKEASEFGNMLVVGVNSDESVRRLKGEKRPFNTLDDRMCILSSIEFVDYVVSFDESTPFELISKIRPDILIKGSDYKKESIVGKDIVESYGGRVELVPLQEGKSTSMLIAKIRE